MGGRALVIVVVGMMFNASIFMNRMNKATSETTLHTGRQFMLQQAQNLAHGGVNIALRRLMDDATWRSGFTNLNMIGGRVTVAVTDTVFDGTSVVAVHGFGNAGELDGEEITATSTAFMRKGFLPPGVKGLITTRGPVALNGNILIDGRDHTISGGVRTELGTYGIWSESTVRQGGSADVGGTLDRTDFLPARPAEPGVIKELQPPAGIATPDDVLGGSSTGFAEGSLKAIAQTGVAGSQYVNDPSRLRYPLRGITFVELPEGSEWKGAHIEGSGILVVHNAAGDATLKNVNSGRYIGLVIVDDLVHLHSQIIGAVVLLTPRPSSGNVMGNGNGSAKFSREAIFAATANLMRFVGNGSSSHVIAWRE
jgi:hypothetical protein